MPGGAGHTVLILEGGVPGGQAATTPNVENWPGTPAIGGADFAMNLYQQVQDLGAEVAFAAVTGLPGRRSRTRHVLAGDKPFRPGGHPGQRRPPPGSWTFPARRGWRAAAFPTVPPATAAFSGAGM